MRATSLPGRAWSPAVVDDVREVVRKAGTGTHREAGDHCEDRGKGHRTDESKETAHHRDAGECRSDHVGVRFAIGEDLSL